MLLAHKIEIRPTDEQAVLLDWAQAQSPAYPALQRLLAIPNGLAASSIGAARRMKAQGMKAGVPDLLLPYPVAPYAGLWIELKRRSGGRLSSVQRDWLAYLAAVGYRAEVCRGWWAARTVILDYLLQGQEPGELDAPF